jgi:hypothetical protein
MQNTKSYVASLFSGYEETKSLTDFKEELEGHLNDKIADFIKKGLGENEAFQKASAQLGDISAIADELSLKRKQEIYSEAYMGTHKYLTPARTALFILGGAIICFGLLAAAITWFATEMQTGALAVGMVFISSGAGFLTFMGLTQETAANYPMPWKRALLYTVSVTVFLFGLLSAPLVYFATTGLNPAELAAQGWTLPPENLGLTSSIATMLAIMLPGAALFAFLVLTEKGRMKPWAKQQHEKEMAMFSDPVAQMRFGLYSGAIWIAAITLCILLGLVASFKISWIVFLFAIAMQLFVQGVMMRKEKVR